MKISKEFKKLSLLGIIIGFSGFLGTVSSIMADFGLLGIITSIILSLILFFVCYWLLKPILVKNARGGNIVRLDCGCRTRRY